MNVLFVCTGNTCRSPMAEGYLKAKMPDLSVKSRGLSADSSPASPNSVKACLELGIDISKHVSTQLNMGDIAWADKIICMSPSHKTVLLMYTNSQKVSVLGDGIPDPYGGDIDIYRTCRDAIFSAVDKLIENGFFSEFYITAMEREHIKPIADLEKICFSEPWSEDGISESYKNGTKFFVGIENGKVLGYIGIICIIDEGYITNVAVFPESRKKGVGTALLERVFSLAKDMGLSFVSLEVRESNIPAISLYEKLGFKQEGKRKDFYRDPKEDALILTKRFD